MFVTSVWLLARFSDSLILYVVRYSGHFQKIDAFSVVFWAISVKAFSTHSTKTIFAMRVVAFKAIISYPDALCVLIYAVANGVRRNIRHLDAFQFFIIPAVRTPPRIVRSNKQKTAQADFPQRWKHLSRRREADICSHEAFKNIRSVFLLTW